MLCELFTNFEALIDAYLEDAYRAEHRNAEKIALFEKLKVSVVRFHENVADPDLHRAAQQEVIMYLEKIFNMKG